LLAWAPMRAPEDLSSITAEWLTDALNVAGGAVVTSFEPERIGEEQGWIGEVARLELSYADPVEGAPSSVIVKFSPADPNGVFSSHEVQFYAEIAAGRSLPVPACYYGRVHPQVGGSVLLLEDLSHLRTVKFVEGCTVDEAESAVLALAEVHTAWWNEPTLSEKDWLLSIAHTRFSEWWDRYPEKVRSVLPDFDVSDALIEFGDRFAGDKQRVLSRIEGAPITAIHRDIHVDNILFGSSPGGTYAVLVDWQTAGRGLGISDVAYLLISSLTPQNRRASETRLVDLYHSRLVGSGITGYSIEQCWRDYVISAASKLFITVTATVLVDNSLPHRRAWRRADIERLTAFIEDHDPVSQL